MDKCKPLTTGNAHGRAFRDLEMEAQIQKLTQTMVGRCRLNR